MPESLSRKVVCYNSSFSASFVGRKAMAEVALWVGAPGRHEAAACLKRAIKPHARRWTVIELDVSERGGRFQETRTS